MKYYKMIIARESAERFGDTSTRTTWTSARQGDAPNGWICLGVCGYFEAERGREGLNEDFYRRFGPNARNGHK